MPRTAVVGMLSCVAVIVSACGASNEGTSSTAEAGGADGGASGGSRSKVEASSKGGAGGASSSTVEASAGGISSGGNTESSSGGASSGGASSGGASSGGSPETSGTWFGYIERLLGFATIRVTSAFADGDCSMSLVGLDDEADFELIRYEGTCRATALGWDFALHGLSWDQGIGPIVVTTEDADYAGMRSRLWGDSDLKRIVVSSESDGTRTIGFSIGAARFSVPSRREPDDASHSERRGTYPEVNYVGLNAHGNPMLLSLSLEAMQLAYAGPVNSVTVTVSGPSGEKYEDISLAYDADAEDFGTKFALASYPSDGLWYVSRADVVTEKGGTATLFRSTPFDDFEQEIHTSAGDTISGSINTDFYRWLAQDYAPPQTGVKWLYVEAYKNGSSVERVDPALYAYRQGQLSQWFAANDDAGGELMPALKLPVIAGERIYVEVKDIYRNGGAYALYASLSDGDRSTTETVSVDTLEPDDNAVSARALPLDTFQNHLFQSIGESDWVAIDVP